MELYDSIFVRKSTRKLKKDKISAEQQSAIMDFAANATPLYPEIKTKFLIVAPSEINTVLAVKAPHYLLVYSEKKQGDLANAGFLLQQIDLYLATQEIGSCWLGASKPKVTSLEGFEFVIMLAIGVPNEPVHRISTEDFKRKTLPEISQGEDVRLEAARLAPSARNGQPWFFVCGDSDIKIYRKKPRSLMNAIIDRLTQIDIGITMCHLMLAGEKNGIAFAFDPKTDLPTHEDLIPVGVLRG